MLKLEIYEEEEKLLRTCDLPYVPRKGEYLSIEADGYFKYYDVIEVWIRVPEQGDAAACILVKLRD